MLRKVPSMRNMIGLRQDRLFLEEKKFFFRENGANGCRVPVGSRGVPKPLVDWHGMRVFPRW